MEKRKIGWLLLAMGLLTLILMPFLLFGQAIEIWTQDFLRTAAGREPLVAGVLSSLLASDILLPVPSSLVSVAAGMFLGILGGTLASLAGMTVSCLVGYWLGNRFGRPIAARMVGGEELEKMAFMSRRLGSWVIILARPVPVLAEASVLFAGMSRMPAKRFMVLAFLSNLGISVVYATIGALSATLNSFLLAVAASILLPLSFMLLRKNEVDEVEDGVP